MRNADPDLARGDLLDGVRFVEDDEVVREKITALAFLLLFRAAEEHEEQRVIDDDDVRREQSFARLLEETIARLAAGLGRADVRFAANLRPDFRVRLERQIAERAVLRSSAPIRAIRTSSACSEVVKSSPACCNARSRRRGQR